ncbi:MAG: hypothetical protein JWN98_1704 [Abditibacteriota bacterium]|jgi:osmotically-inducible protein OsmY|nr:hypothetical protein [Abditibacteriota bacterium]
MKHIQSTLVAASLFLGGSAAHAQSTFPDVPDNHWAAAAVKTLAGAGIIEGFPGRAEGMPRVGRAAPAQSTLQAAVVTNGMTNGAASVATNEVHVVRTGTAMSSTVVKSGTAVKAGATTLTPKIKAALAASASLKKTSIDVEVMDCCNAVTLSGRVGNAKQKQLAAQIAKTHAPKYMIVNELKVTPVKVSRNR